MRPVAPSREARARSAPLSGPIRVFHLIKSLGRGGAETLLLETLRSADRDHFEYSYGYFLPWKDALVEALEADGVSVKCFAAKNNVAILLAARRIADHVLSRGVDVLHCHLPIAGVVGRLAGRMAGVPVVYTEHNKMERYHPLTRRMSLATWRWQERVVAVSEDVARSIHAHAGAGVPVDVVLNGVDVRRFDRDGVDTSSIRAELGIPASAPVVGTVAVFRAQKRLDHWIEAARLLRGLHPAARFLLVGDGPLRAELQAHAERLGMAQAIDWVGLQADVRPYLAMMDVYMMSSEVEGLPIALLEAMSMRCAVVSTSVGGIPEVVKDGENGALVPPGRPDLLAEAVTRMLRSPGQLESAGVAARRCVEERFSVSRMTRQLEGLYREVVSRRRAV